MADKHAYGVQELKLGASFTNNKASQYHTIKYDFKPASVDVNKMATVDVGTNNQVTVTVPHLDGAGVPQTVFKGNQRPYTKECVLIIDRVTGEITLEKLSSNIQVKKTRQETAQKPRPHTPVTTDFTNTTQRSSSRTRVATNKRTNHPAVSANPAGSGPPNSQSRFNNGASVQKPQNMVRSPPRFKSSPPEVPWSGGGNSTLASLPMIGFDEAPAPAPAPTYPAPAPAYSAPAPAYPVPAPAYPAPAPAYPAPAPAPTPRPPPDRGGYGAPHIERHQPPPLPVNVVPQEAAESSSSSSSDSDSDSGSDSDDDHHAPDKHTLPNGNSSNTTALPSDVLNDDLCLSESGSDSD